MILDVAHELDGGACRVCGETAEWITAQTWRPFVDAWLGDHDEARAFAFFLAQEWGAADEALAEGHGVTLPVEWDAFVAQR